MIVGCYSLHLYCDTEPACPFPPSDGSPLRADGDHYGQNKSECMEAARKRGWKFTIGRKAYCPDCSKAKSPAA